MLPLPWNAPGLVDQVFAEHGDDIAAVILEPVCLNIGCVGPEPGFLEHLRAVTTRHDALLIFDEVLTGFRLALGGAQERFGVVPDLACYGKAFGCGMPIAGIAGHADFMDAVAPVGQVEVSGTNTGRYLSVVGALAALRELSTPASTSTSSSSTTTWSPASARCWGSTKSPRSSPDSAAEWAPTSDRPNGPATWPTSPACTTCPTQPNCSGCCRPSSTCTASCCRSPSAPSP
ncbi:aminotransferase class III-fold pyridoxal phosphate-dependent enzyme [Streptomyces zhihengii]